MIMIMLHQYLTTDSHSICFNTFFLQYVRSTSIQQNIWQIDNYLYKDTLLLCLLLILSRLYRVLCYIKDSVEVRDNIIIIAVIDLLL